MNDLERLESYIETSNNKLEKENEFIADRKKKNRALKKRVVEAVLFSKYDNITRNYLGLREDSISFGKDLIRAIIDGNYQDISTAVSNEDTVESAIVKMMINEGCAKAKEKKESDEFSDDEVNDINSNVDKFSTEKLDEKIADNVSDAETKFIADRNDRMEMIKSAYEKIKSTSGGDGNEDEDKTEEEKADEQEEKEKNESAYKRILTKDKDRTMCLFEAIVSTMADNYTNLPETKAFVSDSKGNLDIGKVVDLSRAVYTALETFNGYQVMKFNSQDIHTILSVL